MGMPMNLESRFQRLEQALLPEADRHPGTDFTPSNPTPPPADGDPRAMQVYRDVVVMDATIGRPPASE